MTSEGRALVESLRARLVALDDIDGRLVVGCSGGADSLALVAILASLDFELTAVHVDHGLRADSGSEADHVRTMLAPLRVPTVGVRVDVDPGANLEARARAARYDALETAGRDIGAVATCVAHTADDQAETVLLNLLRGSAAAGLGGMAPVRGRLRRPLLALRRAETAALCAAFGLQPLHDPMNEDLTYRRVRVRHEVLPLLDAVAERDIVPVLVRQADVLRSESELLDAMARDALARAGDPPAARVLGALADPLLRRAVRVLVGHPYPTLAHIDEVIDVVRGNRLAAEVGCGRRVSRRAGAIVVESM